jgi:D-alanyl-D-alanine carboxypeptidase
MAAALIFAALQVKGRLDTDESGAAEGKAETANGENVYSSDAVTSGSAAGSGEEEEKADIDNAWAMFLVNDKNPLPDGYGDTIEKALVYEDYREYYLDARAADYMLRMLDAAGRDGYNLCVVSAYRTPEYQRQLFDNSVNERMGRGMSYDEAYADTALFVALPNMSEHNSGLAADVMSVNHTNMDDDSFKDTAEYGWLRENAADYGFILRYPEGKTRITGIAFEPWHYRFVGVYHAKEIKKLGICLEEYFELLTIDD